MKHYGALLSGANNQVDGGEVSILTVGSATTQDDKIIIYNENDGETSSEYSQTTGDALITTAGPAGFVIVPSAAGRGSTHVLGADGREVPISGIGGIGHNTAEYFVPALAYNSQNDPHFVDSAIHSKNTPETIVARFTETTITTASQGGSALNISSGNGTVTVGARFIIGGTLDPVPTIYTVTSYSNPGLHISPRLEANVPFGTTLTFVTVTDSVHETIVHGDLLVTETSGTEANVTIEGNLSLQGDLTVLGSTTTLNVGSLSTDDKYIAVNSSAQEDFRIAGDTAAMAPATATTINIANINATQRAGIATALLDGNAPQLIVDNRAGVTITAIGATANSDGSFTLTIPQVVQAIPAGTPVIITYQVDATSVTADGGLLVRKATETAAQAMNAVAAGTTGTHAGIRFNENGTGGGDWQISLGVPSTGGVDANWTNIVTAANAGGVTTAAGARGIVTSDDGTNFDVGSESGAVTIGIADAGIIEDYLLATNDPTAGQVLSYNGDTNSDFTWIDAGGGGGSEAFAFTKLAAGTFVRINRSTAGEAGARADDGAGAAGLGTGGDLVTSDFVHGLPSPTRSTATGVASVQYDVQVYENSTIGQSAILPERIFVIQADQTAAGLNTFFGTTGVHAAAVAGDIIIEFGATAADLSGSIVISN